MYDIYELTNLYLTPPSRNNAYIIKNNYMTKIENVSKERALPKYFISGN